MRFTLITILMATVYIGDEHCGCCDCCGYCVFGCVVIEAVLVVIVIVIVMAVTLCMRHWCWR